jgi:hypothetical protein
MKGIPAQQFVLPGLSACLLTLPPLAQLGKYSFEAMFDVWFLMSLLRKKLACFCCFIFCRLFA